MMKKGIYSFLAVLTVFAMVLTGCPEPESENGSTKRMITLNPKSLTVDVGKSAVFTATVTPPLTGGATLTATSSDPTVATVTYTGQYRVDGIKEGSATITVKAPDGTEASCAVTVVTPTSDYVVEEGQTLVHYKPRLRGVDHFGNQQGITNEDGSYTFDGNAGSWSGGGAQYNFPSPIAAGSAWQITNYDIVEMYLKVTDGSVNVKFAKSGNNSDLRPYPDATNQVSLTSATTTYKFVIGEAGTGIGFQRNNGGPATVAIEKVVFSKGTIRTIKFEGGDYPAMSPIPDIKIPDGRTVNFSGNYAMPLRPLWADHTFTGWLIKDDNTGFIQSTPITKDLTLVAQWKEGAPPDVNMSLNLDSASWGALPVNGALTGGTAGYTIPSDFASTSYSNNILTITFDGKNRQRAIIPLSKEQVDELLNTQEGGVTFKIVGTVARGEPGSLTDSQIAAGELGFAGFRLHLADPAANGSWNGTDTGKQTPLTGNAEPSDDHLTEYRSFSGNKKEATVSWFVIQAMFRDSNNNPDALPNSKDNPWSQTFPKVILTINSITIDIGDTTNQ